MGLNLNWGDFSVKKKNTENTSDCARKPETIHGQKLNWVNEGPS
jgi:hypothetical protein